MVSLLLVGLVVLGALASAAGAQTSSGSAHPNTPLPVADGTATLHGHHNRASILRMNVGLFVRNSAQLDALIKAASTPGNPGYRHYLTQAQYLAGYAPTDVEVATARAWLSRRGLHVTGVSPDNLLIHVTATTAAAERAFGVSINDYSVHGRAFFANDRDPVIPSYLQVEHVSGLDDFTVYKPLITCTNGSNPGSQCAFDGGDFRGAYNISGDASGQTLGFTLWGQELPQSDYDGYANLSGNPDIVIGQAGDDGLNWVQVDGSTTESDTDTEVALDTQIAHGVSPKVHETYYLGHDNSYATLEDVLNQAANSSIQIFSNSWGAQANPCSIDSNMENDVQHGASVGKTFYFATGDSGASSGCSYPASSQYVVAVGGTTLAFGSGNLTGYTSESALDNGGGCLDAETRPAWQTGIGNAFVWGSSTPCTGRATPDVSANSGSGTTLYYDGAPQCCWGGTSLATPIWAAASVIWNKNNAASGRPGIGFAGPLIYSLANDATDYANDFHDVTTGTNGFAATTGWDEATGWGSLNFGNLSNNLADITYTGPTSVNHGDTITLSATLVDHGTSNGLSGRTISFAAAGESCTGTTDSSGNASCSVTIIDRPGSYSVIAVFAGDAGYKAVSTTQPFTVNQIATTVTYTGPASGDYNDSVSLSATLTNSSDNTGVANETLNFSLGAESCSATTNSNGNASCSVTPLDSPGSYSAGVSFAGDATYLGSSSSAPFTLNQEESAVAYTGPTTVHYHDPLTASARLTDPDGGAPIAGKTIAFTLDPSDSCSAVTDTSGNASCSLTPHVTGTQSLVAAFAGDAYYKSSSKTQLFSIAPEETTMTYTGPTVILAGASGATLTAKMVEDGTNDNDGDGGSSAPNPAETVTLALGTQTCTGTTDSSGNVSCTISSVTVPLGPETVGATFAGDAYYAASNNSKTAIVFAFPSRGAFTLGNLTAAAATSTTTVTWWADTWAALNRLSGGPAPSADKGFAGTVTLPTTTPAGTCGGNWSTTSGNSPPPTNGVPSYMGTLVTSKVTKTGSGIAGNTISIVVVKTNPGYQPNPMDHGTGVIVAKYC